MIVLNTLLIIFLMTTYLIYSSISVFIMFVIRLFLIFNKDAQYRFTMLIKQLWLSLTVTLLGFYLVHPIYIYYNKEILKKKRCLVLSNHFTNFDWIYIIVILERLGMYEDLIIILKDSLSKIPIYGYGMRVFGYIFLKREWNVDREILEHGLRSLSERERFYLLLFPEGTFIDPISHEKSKKFCSENNLLVDGEPFNPNHVILPRKTGFEMIHDYLKTHIDGIIDITLLNTPYKNYPSEEFTLYDIFIKRSRKINMSCYVNFIGLDTRHNDNWIYEIFKAKDKFISKFSHHEKYKTPVEFNRIIEDIVKPNNSDYRLETVYMWSSLSKIYIIMTFLLITGIVFLICK